MDSSRSELPPEYDMLDTSQASTKHATPPKPSRWTSLSSDTWMYEGIAIGFSLSCLIAIIAVLSAYDKKPSPQLSYGLTLNTIVAVLSTASKTSLVFLVGEAIGQLKWNWFHQRHRPLIDLQSFDNASRGPLGSIVLLFQHKGLSLVSLGAAITLLALTLDPFMQQILTYPIKQASIQSDSASAKHSLAFVNSLNDATGIDFDILSAVNAGVWSSNFQVDPACPTGNCTWPIYRSIEFCHHCKDVTSDTEIIGCPNPGFNTSDFKPAVAECNATLPGGISIPLRLELINDTSPFTYPTVNVPSDRVVVLEPKNGTYLGRRNPMFVVSHVALGYPDNIKAPLTATTQNLTLTKATQCVMSLCARTYNTTVSNGNPTFQVMDAEYGELIYHEWKDFDWGAIPSYDCWQPGSGREPLVDFPPGTREGVAYNTAELAFCPAPYLNGLLNQIQGTRNYTWWYLASWSQGLQVNSGNSLQRAIDVSLPTIISNIAASLTKLALDRSDWTVNGTVSHAEVQVAVDWRWIILPALLLVAGIVFLALVMWTNQKDRLNLWKSSVLPVLYHGLDDNLLPGTSQDTTSVSRMDQSASVVRAKMKFSDDKRRYMFSQ